MTSFDNLQSTRRETLLKLAERYIPDNTEALIGEAALPAFAAVSRGRDGDWISLHENGQDALDYFAQDDSDYAPRLLVHLESGEEREIVSETSFRIADATGATIY